MYNFDNFEEWCLSFFGEYSPEYENETLHEAYLEAKRNYELYGEQY